MKEKKRYRRRIEMFNSPYDIKNLVFNIFVLIFLSIVSLFVDRGMAILFISIGVFVNLLYFFLCYIGSDKYWEEIKTNR